MHRRVFLLLIASVPIPRRVFTIRPGGSRYSPFRVKQSRHSTVSVISREPDGFTRTAALNRAYSQHGEEFQVLLELFSDNNYDGGWWLVLLWGILGFAEVGFYEFWGAVRGD